ncbi:hypothetical protein V1279_003403 [Bradyrhizobium sp. AZCC 1610]|uniref:hypothetical protein n=1 Tax=Bradyrhizobium sp. AZCC 1610 TaxID=3117020 RepID=UPI002FF3CE42
MKLALFVLKFSIQDINDPLMQVPEVIKPHCLQFSVFHAQPHVHDPTHDGMNLAKEKPPGRRPFDKKPIVKPFGRKTASWLRVR